LGDDPGEGIPPDVSTIAARTARLCRIAEEVYKREKASPFPPLYIIGSDVPIPGGAHEDLNEVPVTSADDVARTVNLTREAFEEAGLGKAWERVIAVVVQPGVEFSDHTVIPYDSQRALNLSQYIASVPGLVYEAHSTDYQLPRALRKMVEDHFSILKVGPGLTYTFREAVFALTAIENEWLSSVKGISLSNLIGIIDKTMRKHPRFWEKHYHGTPDDQAFARKYSLSDRIRYYWPRPEIREALTRMLNNLTEKPPPLSLISQYLPNQYLAVRKGRISSKPQDLIRHKIKKTIIRYRYAVDPASVPADTC
jgi:D-tagatose-1,6-bisphosphate aldolase subunit GatZ/KbaZ